MKDANKVVKKVLITQEIPESNRSPYFEIAKKYAVSVEFMPFIRLEPIPSKEFRKQKVDISEFTSIIFTSRHAIENFFRICEELKITMSADTKFFCISEAVALFLQKFTQYRKRKVFFSTDGTNKSLFEVISKQKECVKFLYPCSENQQDNEIVTWLKNYNCEFHTPFMYRTASNDIKEFLDKEKFDVICFFTPSGVKSLFDNFPDYQQNATILGAFGNNTFKAIQDAGLQLHIKAPEPQTPSLISALDKYFAAQKM
jgi:uroporphyrinogen-III synthase